MRDSYLEDFYTFLRFPSISTDDAYTEKLGECAHWLVEKLNGIGLEAQLVSTAGHPVVWAKNKHQPGRKTVMLYGHYDVQPPDPLELWDSPPFDPVLKNGYVFARGATDNKGQILAHILGIQETMEENGDLPVNLHLIVEGEEEIGSGNLPGFLQENRDSLRCDVAVVSDTGMIARGVPTLSYGLRGVTALEVKMTGREDGFALGSFRRRRWRIRSPRSRSCSRPCTTERPRRDRRFLRQGEAARGIGSAKPGANCRSTATKILDETGAPALFGEKGYSTLERLWARPTAEINGIGGGYQGKGTKTVIASHAMAKLTFRLVPNQDGAAILKLAEKHLEKHLPPGVTMEITDGHSGPWYLTDPHSSIRRSRAARFEESFQSEVALIREGGSIPIVSQFRDILGVETLLLGLALADCRAHSPNENFPLENLEAGIKMNKAILQELAAPASRADGGSSNQFQDAGILTPLRRRMVGGRSGRCRALPRGAGAGGRRVVRRQDQENFSPRQRRLPATGGPSASKKQPDTQPKPVSECKANETQGFAHANSPRGRGNAQAETKEIFFTHIAAKLRSRRRLRRRRRRPRPQKKESPSLSPAETPSPAAQSEGGDHLAQRDRGLRRVIPAAVRHLLEDALELTRRNLDYIYGSADPANGGMDCSGFIYYVLRKNGAEDVPRDASEQYVWVRKAGNFRAVLSRDIDSFELDELKPGDLLFWTGTYSVERDPPVTHTMIYLGKEKKSGRPIMVGASDGRTYEGDQQFGVSVFDFKTARVKGASASGTHPRFVGYGKIPELGA